MQTSLVLLLLGVAVCWAGNGDIVCKKGKLSKKINVGEGDSYLFKKQAGHGSTYAHNTKCVATYKKKASCPEMRFSCSQFNVNNKRQNCKGKDVMQIQANGKKKFYCKKNGPDVTTTGKTLKVSFLSDKRKHSSGAVCRIECVSPVETTIPPPTEIPECNCGKKKTSRIVGGTETEINEYPWMAAITFTSGFFFCGGTLITSEWVVTASHCMFRNSDGTNPLAESEIRVVLGDHDKTSTTENTIPRIVIQVSQIITHPTYTASTSNNDIALLKLGSAVNLSVYTPACLPQNGAKFVGQQAWVYGWGTTSSGGSLSDVLLEVQVPVVSNAVCIAAMQNTITDAMLCAGGELNKDGCQGDSGGPLTVDVDGKHFLIGDVSFGNGCGQQGQYGVYGDVAYFRTSFIDANIGDAKNCP